MKKALIEDTLGKLNEQVTTIVTNVLEASYEAGLEFLSKRKESIEELLDNPTGEEDYRTVIATTALLGLIETKVFEALSEVHKASKDDIIKAVTDSTYQTLNSTYQKLNEIQPKN